MRDEVRVNRRPSSRISISAPRGRFVTRTRSGRPRRRSTRARGDGSGFGSVVRSTATATAPDGPDSCGTEPLSPPVSAPPVLDEASRARADARSTTGPRPSKRAAAATSTSRRPAACRNAVSTSARLVAGASDRRKAAAAATIAVAELEPPASVSKGVPSGSAESMPQPGPPIVSGASLAYGHRVPEPSSAVIGTNPVTSDGASRRSTPEFPAAANTDSPAACALARASSRSERSRADNVHPHPKDRLIVVSAGQSPLCRRWQVRIPSW